MGRIRTIKPDFFTSLTIADLPLSARLTFIGLWTHADDEGRCIADPRLIKAAVWPLDDVTADDVQRDLGVLTEASLITQYEVGNRRYLAVKTWREHQRINRPTPSQHPSPEDGQIVGPACSNEASPGTHGALSESSLPERKGKEQGKERKKTTSETPAALPDNDATTTDAVDRICTHLADRIEQSGSRRPTPSGKWREAARLMLTRDQLTEENIHRAIDWCQDSEFWRANILSLPKLREKYDTLRLQAARSPTTQTPRSSTTDERVMAGMALAAEMRELDQQLAAANRGRNEL